ncbi:MAG: nucleotidyl transferase AbiEii/AbiGii toxin family protein [Candidatus Eremiobacterota bacterium]
MLLDKLREIRKLAIISLFSDDDLMDIFVLKGGNALDIVYNISGRASIDIDVAMENDFSENELESVKEKLIRAFEVTFQDANYIAFDFKFAPRPSEIKNELKNFWGGYRLEFKLTEKNKYEKSKNNLDLLRKTALDIDENQKKTFKIDISKYEFCKGKKEKELDELTIYVYTPLMIICEKLRAICQQMELYRKIVPTNRKGRAKDFFDIYVIDTIIETPINLTIPENFDLLKEIFKIKKVPLELLGKIDKEREFHRDSFWEVKNSVYNEQNIKDYDFYFDYVLNKVNQLKSPGVI